MNSTRPSLLIGALVACLTLLSTNALAQSAPPASASAPAKATASTKKSEIADIIDKLDYPELQVVPRASQRLRMEAEAEDQSWYYTHWPVQFSGLSTLVVGFMAKSMERTDLNTAQQSELQTISTISQFIGAGWLVGGAVIGWQKPYRAGLQQIARYQDKDETGVLLRERLAEEALERPARLMRTLKWASVATNLSMNILMASYLDEKGAIMAGVSAVFAFMPVVFEDRSIDVYDKHLEYKKKIYAPLTSATLLYDRSSNSLVPGTYLAWTF